MHVLGKRLALLEFNLIYISFARRERQERESGERRVQSLTSCMAPVERALAGAAFYACHH